MIKSRARRTVASRTATSVSPPRARAARAADCRVLLGELVAWDERGPLVRLAGSAGAPIRARVSGAVRPPARPAPNQEIVLLVDPRPRRAPVLLGILQPLEAEVASELEARIDGRRVELEGRDEILLRCGEASITLRRNGRVIIRGIQVETRAEGLNRIKGGSVSIN